MCQYKNRDSSNMVKEFVGIDGICTSISLTLEKWRVRVSWLTKMGKSFELFFVKESYYIHMWIESKIVNAIVAIYDILHYFEKN